MTEVDHEDKTGLCSICGPVRIKIRASRGSVTCATVKQAEDRRRRLKKKYGVTQLSYEQMLEAQEGRCAICKKRPQGRQLAVDHCHTTAKIRGLLCTNCNVAIGMLLDDPDIALAAREYLLAA